MFSAQNIQQKMFGYGIKIWRNNMKSGYLSWKKRWRHRVFECRVVFKGIGNI